MLQTKREYIRLQREEAEIKKKAQEEETEIKRKAREEEIEHELQLIALIKERVELREREKAYLK